MDKKNFTYRLGINAGNNSMGFCIMELNNNNTPLKLHHLGVTAFPEGRVPKTGESLATVRRTARQAMRMTKRRKQRAKKVINLLIEAGLMPCDKIEREKLVSSPSPSTLSYELRAKGLDSRLENYELGLALFNINQRRGFHSNRIQATKNDDTGLVKEGIAKLKTLLQENQYRTIGEFLCHSPIKRIRPIMRDNKTFYDFFPQREMLKQEFDMLVAEQQKYHPSLTPETFQTLKDTTFFQRPLRPVQKGRCSLLPEEERAYAALPSSQRFRILKEVNDLKIIDKSSRKNQQHLNNEQREIIVPELYKKKKVTFDRLRKILDLDESVTFSVESMAREYIGGATTFIALFNEKCFGSTWNEFNIDQQDRIVSALLDEYETENLFAWLENEFQLSADNIHAIMDTALEDGTLRYSTKAIQYLLPEMEAGRSEYDILKQCKEEGLFPDAKGYDGSFLDRLPYYGEILKTRVGFGTGKPEDSDEQRYGRIANPTVHIALNQVRKIVNDIIKEYGHPSEIAIQVGGELGYSRKDKERIRKEIAKNAKENEILDQQIREVFPHRNPSAEDRLRLKLHKQQEGLCVYSGRAISLTEALSNATAVNHILPFSRTLDDSKANKVLVSQEFVRIKGTLSPYEAKDFLETAGIDYDTLLARTSRLPGSKRWRFLPDAMQKFSEEEGFLARELNDYRYIAKVMREYLQYVTEKLDTYPGALTAKLRYGWGFNSLLNPDGDNTHKNRDDYRHRAIDALIIACANRSLLQQISRASARAAEIGEEWYSNLLERAKPYLYYSRSGLEQMVSDVIVYHKPDHSAAGKLHQETCYGRMSLSVLPPEKVALVIRVPFLSLTEKDIKNIRDKGLRERAIKAEQNKPEGQKFSDTLASLAKERNIKGVRIIVEKTLRSVKELKRGYVATASNHHIDIYIPIKGKKAGKWCGEVVSTFDANQKDFEPQWRKGHPTAKLVMRLHRNDILALGNDGKREIWRVSTLDAFFNSPHLTPNIDTTDERSLKHSPRQLQKKNARKIAIMPAGKIYDPGKAPMPKISLATREKAV